MGRRRRDRSAGAGPTGDSLVGAGITTREEARADLGLAPAGKPQAGLGKFNPHHDERGRFSTADNAGEGGAQRSSEPLADVRQHPASETPGDNSRYAFAGILIDKRYDENINVTHCTYRTPFGTYTHEYKGYVSCPETMPAP